MFQTWFQKSTSLLFQKTFSIIFFFFWLNIYNMPMAFHWWIHFFNRNAQNIYEKMIFWMLWSWSAFCFQFFWLDDVGTWSQKKSSSSGMSNLGNGMDTVLILVDLLMIISHLVKHMKRDNNYIYLCSKQSIGKYLYQNLTVSLICIYPSAYCQHLCYIKKLAST